MTEAKRKINLADIGVISLRFRVAQAGGRIIEIPGEGGARKADALAVRLRKALSDQEIRVARPVKTADVRLSGLDDSITGLDVQTAFHAAFGVERAERYGYEEPSSSTGSVR